MFSKAVRGYTVTLGEPKPNPAVTMSSKAVRAAEIQGAEMDRVPV